eukprot:5146486-Pyramimonas_sp.AAC.1
MRAAELRVSLIQKLLATRDTPCSSRRCARRGCRIVIKLMDISPNDYDWWVSIFTKILKSAAEAIYSLARLVATTEG